MGRAKTPTKNTHVNLFIQYYDIVHIILNNGNQLTFLKFQCLLGLDFVNTNKSGDMAELLKKFQEDHVPMNDGNVLKKTIVHGDQLTEERARNVQWTYKLGDSEADRLEGLECTFSEFHLKMCLYEVTWIELASDYIKLF